MQLSLCTYTIEDLVPQDHLARKLAAALDLNIIYEETRALYSKIGRRQKKRTKQIKRDRRHPHMRVSRTDPEAGYLKSPKACIT